MSLACLWLCTPVRILAALANINLLRFKRRQARGLSARTQRHSKALVAKMGFLGSHRSQAHTHGYMPVLRAGSVVDVNQLGLVRINRLKQRRVVTYNFSTGFYCTFATSHVP